MSYERGHIRLVQQIIEPQAVIEGAGVRLKRSFPIRALDYPDPFLLFDHFGSNNPADYLAGFPMHPHRGIETVTYMLSGIVHHRDTLGNAGSITAGDVQWMTAGGGIMHEEMPRPQDGKLEGFQLWVNLPSRLKMTKPHYQEIPSSSIPEVMRSDGTRIRIIAGVVDGVRGPVIGIAADPIYLDVHVPPHASFVQPIEKGCTVLVYVFEGQALFESMRHRHVQVVKRPRMVVLGDGDYVEVRAMTQPLRFLFMAGRPSREPIVRYGPFVMTKLEEIEQALRDLRNGTFVR